MSYFYPTELGWIQNMWNAWQATGRPHLSFPFLKYHPTTFPPNPFPPFWMYLYYTKNCTAAIHLKGRVEFRVQVIAYQAYQFNLPNLYVYHHTGGPDEVIWFQVNRIEEIRCGYRLLSANDFSHANRNKALLQSIRNSIAPCICHCNQLQILRHYP